jgi:hypothetical protein
MKEVITMIRYKRKRSAAINPPEVVAEPGDLWVRSGRLYRLETPSGRDAKDAGLLYPRLIKPPAPGLFAIVKRGETYWVHNPTPNRKDHA